MDVRDSCWKEYFSNAEIDEIKRYEAIELPDLPVDVKAYMDELTATPRSELFEKSGFHRLTDVTEQGMGRRVWSCVDKCFDFSGIRCLTGEKCSKATADASNKDRCLSDVGRQSSGRKMDYLFTTKKTVFEVGCGECVLVGGIKTTKEFQDAGFKMPKLMRDMANSILATYAGLENELCLVGYYIGGTVMRCNCLHWIFLLGMLLAWMDLGLYIFQEMKKRFVRCKMWLN
ncbi:hypothetical protein PS6_007355 [Mucor atramentarius]